jgi:hypothetical protein
MKKAIQFYIPLTIVFTHAFLFFMGCANNKVEKKTSPQSFTLPQSFTDAAVEGVKYRMKDPYSFRLISAEVVDTMNLQNFNKALESNLPLDSLQTVKMIVIRLVYQTTNDSSQHSCFFGVDSTYKILRQSDSMFHPE